MSTIEIRPRPYVGQHRAADRPPWWRRGWRWAVAQLAAVLLFAGNAYDRVERTHPLWWGLLLGVVGFALGFALWQVVPV